MNDESVSDALLRQVLLHNADDEQCQHIETLFLTDPVMRERVHAAEQELIDDYLEDALSIADKETFVFLYAQTPEQQRRLRITKSIKDWAVAEYDAHEAPATEPARTDTATIWNRLRLRPALIVPIAAMIILAVVFGVIWSNRRIEQTKHAAIEQEVARLNNPSSLRDTPPAADALTLRPLALRSIEPQAELKRRPDEPVIELHLLLLQKERYPTYQVVVRRPGDAKPITARNVVASEDGNTIRLRLPSQNLPRGLYRIELSGITASGAVIAPEEYQFTIVE
jgi:hypothetical protein